MLKRMFAMTALAACTAMFIGCDKGSSAASAAKKDVKDAADKGKDAIKDATDKGKEMVKDAGKAAEDAAKAAADQLAKAKEAITSKFTDLPKIEEAIGKLTGDKLTAGKAALESFKKLLTEFKDAPMDKVADLGKKLTDAFAELKKMAGM